MGCDLRTPYCAASRQRASARSGPFQLTASCSSLALAVIRLANIFVRRFDLMLRAPDALHAAICRRGDLLLVTLDHRLAAATGELGIQTELLSAMG